MSAVHYSNFDLKSMFFPPVSRTKKTVSLQVKIQTSATDERPPKIQMNLPPPQEPCVKFPFGMSVFGDEPKIKKSLNFQIFHEPLKAFWNAFNEHMIDVAYANRETWFPNMDDPSREFIKQIYYPIYGVAKKNKDKYEPTVRTKAYDNPEKPQMSVRTFRMNPETKEIKSVPCSQIVSGTFGMPNVCPQSIWLKTTQWGVSAIITETVLFPGQEQKDVEEVFSWGTQQPVKVSNKRSRDEDDGDEDEGPSKEEQAAETSAFQEPSILLQGSAKRARLNDDH